MEQHSIYDFTTNQFQYNEKLSASRHAIYLAICEASAAIQPSFNNTTDLIAGTRTSDTIFTPTVSEAWTVDALIGKYLVAIDADTSKVVYTISLIADNNATTVTIGTTWGDAALVANADAILLYDTLDAVFEDVTWVQKT